MRRLSSTFKIKINKLTPSFIKDMKEKYGEAELEITVNREPDFIPLQEDEFWNIIALLDWEKEGETIVEPVIEKLSSLPVAHIYSFEDILSEKLYQLDQQAIAENIGGSEKHFSVDGFLYARACVVANGKEAYETVLNNTTEMPKDITFEPILSIAAKAYQRKTKKEFLYNPSHNYETYSNKEGWKK